MCLGFQIDAIFVIRDQRKKTLNKAALDNRVRMSGSVAETAAIDRRLAVERPDAEG